MATERHISVGAILLAAGAARRMGTGGGHKLLAEFDGCPLVRRSAQTLLASCVHPVIVVTGHRRAEIEAALEGLDVHLAFNPAHASGMGGSLAFGFSHAGVSGRDGMLVMLADMPALTATHIDHLAAAFRRHGGAVIVRAGCDGSPGNPVILPQALYGKVRQLSGDSGARGVIAGSGLPVIEIEIGPAALLDVDTPDAVAGAGGILKD